MSDRSNPTLRSMVLKGKNYREDYELEYFGETIPMKLRPLNDTEFVDFMERIDEAVDEDEYEDVVADMDELDEDELPDEGDFSKEFVNIMRDAAAIGIDPESIEEETQEDVRELVEGMIGGASIEIGSEVMEITSNLQDAERFRKVG